MNSRIQELAEQADIYSDKHAESRDYVVLRDQYFAELIIRQCGYYADVFEAGGCPVDMDPTETKPSDYIKKQLGIENEQV